MDAPRALTTSHLDYLQRLESGFDPFAFHRSAGFTDAVPDGRRLDHIYGIGRTPDSPLADPTGAPRLVSEDLLIGLHGYRINVAFSVQGGPSGIRLEIGTWSARGREAASPSVLDRRAALVRSVLQGLYWQIDRSHSSAARNTTQNDDQRAWEQGGLVLGVPTAKAADVFDRGLPLDRLTRSLVGAHWAFLILAQPIDDDEVRRLRIRVIDEMREVEAAARSAQTPSPLAAHYIDLLKPLLQGLTESQGTGAWRTGVYLLGSSDGYLRLASAWRSIFAGEASLPEPIKVWDNPLAIEWARAWAMPDVARVEGPGRITQPFHAQTLLTSHQLATYVHLPRLETAGFTVHTVPDFDVVPPPTAASDTTFSLGPILQRNRRIQTAYEVVADDLTRHALVAGVTGSGKTTTIFHLLKQAAACGVNYLVLEPAKAEYRSHLGTEAIGSALHVFTPGRETVSPLRINPFEALPGTEVSEHLDLLRAVFVASFGMWTPLPQVLESCLHAVYVDCGWDLATNTNRRLEAGAPRTNAFPTLSDLVDKVDELTPRLGYEDRITGDIRAALTTRLNALRGGAKGRMLDVSASIPMNVLLDRPTVVELEGMGDDNDKAFLMALLLIRLYEHRRNESRLGGRRRNSLTHILIIEEAHRLLADVGGAGREEDADPRGKAVETFVNLLSEVRAYGQGIVVADQIPLKLARDVIKNTNLKIAHRTVAEDDRRVLGHSMAMNDQQIESLATFRRGQAAVFQEGDDRPVLVHMAGELPGESDEQGNEDVPLSAEPDVVLDALVRKRMAEADGLDAYRAVFLPFPICRATCKEVPAACDQAREIADDVVFQRVFSRVVLSTIEDGDSLDRTWIDVEAIVQSRRPPDSDYASLMRCLLIRGSHWLAARRGRQANWTYADVVKFSDHLTWMLLAKLSGHDQSTAREGFRAQARRLHARTYPPYSGCNTICRHAPLCVYRHYAADLIAARTELAAWTAADKEDAASADGRRAQTWRTSLDSATRLIEFPEKNSPLDLRRSASDAARRVALCFAQQMATDDPGKSPAVARRIVTQLQREAGDLVKEGVPR